MPTGSRKTRSVGRCEAAALIAGFEQGVKVVAGERSGRTGRRSLSNSAWKPVIRSVSAWRLSKWHGLSALQARIEK